ncbi:hypothetical protein M4578_12595 [Salipiger sp. P9]|uniref:hypothetical protein n=1 Tax=Salipiger pentaromativorans TaxID=2943193 RepID=UPI0021574E77|nr:hypothetical protein [Salipiger pentaromativorans]MCR8548670.1 hypothetical protein [Salipiger pentaromativorans]
MARTDSISHLLCRITAVLLCLLLGTLPAGAEAPATDTRRILALYDGRETDRLDETRLHRLAEMPLNFLGYDLIYHDLAQGLPPPAPEARILTWFSGPLPDRAGYLAWITAQLSQGARLAILGDPGLASEGAGDLTGALLTQLGLEISGTLPVTRDAALLWQDDALYGFERALGPVLPPLPLVSARSPQVVTHLAIRAPDGRASAVINSGPRGAWVPPGYAVYSAGTAGYKWLIDPFAFFDRVFGPGTPHPVPDVTTVSGRRIYFSHIDGDGWANVAETPDPSGRKRIAAQAVHDELIAPYPDLPVTVGIIAGDMDPTLGGTPANRAAARALLALPQVEAAAHGYTHPFDWGFYADYDRQTEERLMARAADAVAAARPAPAPLARIAASAAQWLGLPDTQAPVTYATAAEVLPRSYLARPFSLDEEIGGALATVAGLAPPEKSPALYQWTGDTLPFEAAIAATRRAGVANLNGGNARFDALFPSLTSLPPIGRPVGAERQIYAAASNESLYTNEWTGPFWGQALLSQTLDRTEQPRRLKPFNLYYHMFSGEKRASLAVLKAFLDRARDGRHIALPASRYAAIAQGFYSTRIHRVAETVWEITDRGALQTLRIDDPGSLRPDPLASHGLIGVRQVNDALYLALDPAVPEARIALSETPSSAPLLIESGWSLSGLTREDCGFRLRAEGFGPGRMTWGGLPDGALFLTVTRGGAPLWSGEATVSGGIARIDLPLRARPPVEISARCAEGTQ